MLALMGARSFLSSKEQPPFERADDGPMSDNEEQLHQEFNKVVSGVSLRMLTSEELASALAVVNDAAFQLSKVLSRSFEQGGGVTDVNDGDLEMINELMDICDEFVTWSLSRE